MATATFHGIRATGSHWAKDDPGQNFREEVYVYCDVEWRGTTYPIVMEANRYTYSDGELSDWRVFLSSVEAYARDADNPRLRDRDRPLPTPTDTARGRMSDAARPHVVEWLGTDDYTRSRSRAVAAMVLREMEDKYSGVKRATERLAKHRDKLDRDHADTIEEMVSEERSHRETMAELGARLND